MAGNGIRSYRDLVVWQNAVELSVAAYEFARRLPVTERYAMADQIRRAAVSIPANIAEGWAKSGKGFFLNHLSHARGSLRELETLLLIAARVGYGSAGSTEPSPPRPTKSAVCSSVCRLESPHRRPQADPNPLHLCHLCHRRHLWRLRPCRSTILRPGTCDLGLG
jgi:four helix bundle protein